MNKFTYILILFSLLLQANSDNISINQFAYKLSIHNNINIYVDEEIQEKKVSLFVPDKISNEELFNMFENTVHKLNFNLKKSGDTYYLSKKLKYLDKSYVYRLRYNSFKDCQAVLKSLGVKYTYLADLNGFVINATSSKYKKISSFLKSIDIKQSQVMLKIMILEYTDEQAKERGVQYSSIYKGVSGSLEYALNTIVLPISTNNPVLDSVDFYGAIRFLNQNNLVDIKQNPFILAKNNQSFRFEAVENIPYLVTTTTTEASNTSEQNSIEYKDVGLKINGRTFIHDDYITLDIDLVIEDLLLDYADTTMPQTYKRTLKSNTNIEYNKVLLLSGLKKIKHTEKDWSIPYLSNIPYLGKIFQYKYDVDSVINITIAIEVIQSNKLNQVSFEFDGSTRHEEAGESEALVNLTKVCRKERK